jgi:hypothetical protein
MPRVASGTRHGRVGSPLSEVRGVGGLENVIGQVDTDMRSDPE